MTRVKAIGLAASHIMAGIIGILLATRGFDPSPEHSSSAPPVASERPNRPGMIERSSDAARSPRPLKDWRGSEFTKAWNAVREAKLTTKDRIETQRKLLESWAKVDLAAAMQAALEEAWDHDNDESFIPEGPLIGAFADAFGRNPEEAWDLICHGGFGIGSSLLRHVWIRSVGREDPLRLAAVIKDLSWKEREYALNACHHGTWQNEDRTLLNKKVFDQLAALPADIVSSDQLAVFLMAGGGGGDVATIREELLQAANSNDRLAGAKAVVLGQMLADDRHEEIASAIADLPTHLKQEVLGAVLNSRRSSDGESITGLVDLLVAESAWEQLNGREVAWMVLKTSNAGDARGVADWVTTLPYRKETTEMFHRGVETYLRNNMDASKEWIAAIPSQEWRDRAYAEYSQQALNAKKDPAASRWALDQIRDAEFKALAETWRKNWEGRKPPVTR